ncbi:DUF1566 domain-containing protein [Flavobacterium sp. JAS]|uniref:Lcl domain-containing protein n=1 Tax=Flavobacterium sp. JAS TaxID=2897329 RepID=UPI001E2E580E|nr:DUF1566 domain-containing protein [Flavobacterium sp. JAS]MCD0472369.1 DUF1566 domain-containing protein [Flavobacterium sp. JAS]
MSYQAVIRDAKGTLMSEKKIGMEITIVKGTNPEVAVYTETHSGLTDKNGLLTLIIGSGTTSARLNDFNAIDWSNGEYFTKFSIDLKGGKNYSMWSTTTLMSVPYAFHAKTAESIAGVGANSDHYLGQVFEGGIIFHIDSTGKHGLIVSMTDLAIAETWSNKPKEDVGDTARSSWNGNANTTAIAGKGGTSAALLCQNYSNEDYGTGQFSDWYLPSINELEKLWLNIYDVQKTLSTDKKENTKELTRDYYWSSTENNRYTGWGFNFYNGNSYANIKFSNGKIRAVRAF